MKKQPYTITENQVYCATEDHCIKVIDLASGDIAREIKIQPSAGKICGLYAMGEKLYALKGNPIVRIDVTAEDVSSAEQSPDRIIILPENKLWRHALINDKLTLFTKKSFFTIDSKGAFSTKSHSHRYGYDASGPIAFIATDKFILFEDKGCLICFDSNSFERKWYGHVGSERYSGGQCIKQITISPNKDTVFVLNTTEVIAIDPHADDKHRILWRTGIHSFCYPNNQEVDSIHLLEDGSALYGLNRHTGQLYAFDINTGEKKLLEEITLPKSSNIRGDYDGKLYI